MDMRTAPTPAPGWSPRGPLTWGLTILAAVVVVAMLPVLGEVVRPGSVGAWPATYATAVLVFPLSGLIAALIAAAVAVVAWLCRAKLAAAGFALVAAALLSAAMIPAATLRAMANAQQIDVSLVEHFGFATHDFEMPPRVQRDVVYGRAADGTELLLDVWPATAKTAGGRAPAFVRVHGGGWIHGVKSGLANWNVWLNGLGYTVFDIAYRLPPPARWKDEVGDVKCAIGFVLANAAAYGIDPARISLTGYSAGANLALLAATSMGAPELPPSCAAPAVAVRTVVNIYGPTDLRLLFETSPAADIRDALRQYVGGSPADYPERYRLASPVTFVSASSPPVITVEGLSDRIVPADQAEALDRALGAAGVRHETYLLPGADHVFDANWGAISTEIARRKIMAFLEKYG